MLNESEHAGDRWKFADVLRLSVANPKSWPEPSHVRWVSHYRGLVQLPVAARNEFETDRIVRAVGDEGRPIAAGALAMGVVWRWRALSGRFDLTGAARRSQLPNSRTFENNGGRTPTAAELRIVEFALKIGGAAQI
jgi:hypothetical protein